jgi:competence CoiA-like predicted nuclease
MEKKYCCTNPECTKEKKEVFVKVLNQESVMDDKNVAQMFCPKCKSRLVLCEGENKTAC